MFLTIVDVCLGRTNFDWTVCGKKTQTGQILNGAVFIFESILLIVVTVPLFKALLRLQAKNMKLTKEMKMLTTIFLVFTITYALRTVYDWVVPMNGHFGSTFVGIAMPIVWDLLPLMMMLQYHYNSLLAQRKAERNSG